MPTIEIALNKAYTKELKKPKIGIALLIPLRKIPIGRLALSNRTEREA